MGKATSKHNTFSIIPMALVIEQKPVYKQVMCNKTFLSTGEHLGIQSKKVGWCQFSSMYD